MRSRVRRAWGSTCLRGSTCFGGSTCLGFRPDLALVPARIQFDAAVGVGEYPDGEVSVEGTPAGVTFAGEADPCIVHLAGQVLGVLRPDDQGGPARSEEH